MTTDEIRELIRTGRKADFYNNSAWRNLAAEIMREQHHECQYCRGHGKYTRAWGVHHVRHLEDHPELAYSRFFLDENGVKQRQLVAVCFRCHEAQHPERFDHKPSRKFTNSERW